jgi:hypothetical protein
VKHFAILVDDAIIYAQQSRVGEVSMKLVTVEQMRRIEQASDAAGHTYAAMMERAGTAVAAAIEARVAVKNRRVLVLVGPGNNGGDGLVAARALREAEAEVSCYLYRDRPDDLLLIAVGEQGALSPSPNDPSSGPRRLVKGADGLWTHSWHWHSASPRRRPVQH